MKKVAERVGFEPTVIVVDACDLLFAGKNNGGSQWTHNVVRGKPQAARRSDMGKAGPGSVLRPGLQSSWPMRSSRL